MCKPDFKNLVQGALLTACRYGELIKLQRKHFRRWENGQGSLYIADSKSGKPRTVHLTEAGATFFETLIVQKRPETLIFTRIDGGPWLNHAQKKLMSKACADAGIKRIVFHELRHARASSLANSGLDEELTAHHLGHTDTKMVKEFYIHREDERIAARLQETAGQDDWDIVGDPNTAKIQELKPRKPKIG